MIQKTLSFIWRVYALLVFALGVLLLGPWVYLLTFKESLFPKAYALIHLWGKICFYCIGMRYELIAQKPLDNQQNYVVISNHTSVLDIMLMLVLHPHNPITFVGKKELVKVPIFGQIYKRIVVMVDRSSQKSKVEVYRRVAEKVATGRSVVIFPEGGVPDDTSIVLDNFKEGAFGIAVQHEIPMVVYSIIGLKEAFPFSWTEGHPAKIKVYREDILIPSEYQDRKDMQDHARKLILNRLS